MNLPEITHKNFRVLLPGKIAGVIEKICNEKKISGKEALLLFYSSALYRELEIEETKRWWESPAQLYRDLQHEDGQRTAPLTEKDNLV